MDPNVTLIIPVIAVIALAVIRIVKLVMQTDVRKLELRAQIQQQPGSIAGSGEVAALREELARLRDTSTQYDVSLQHALERIEQRLDHVERRVFQEVSPDAKSDPIHQVIGR